MSAKEMFEELGYDYYEDDGITTYLKANCIPDKLNTKYIKFREITFNRIGQEMGVYDYRKNAECTEFLENASSMKMNILTKEELQAINKQVEELGWNIR